MHHSIGLCPLPSRVPRSMLPCRDQMRVTTSPSLSMLTRSQACGYPLHLLLSPLLPQIIVCSIYSFASGHVLSHAIAYLMPAQGM